MREDLLKLLDGLKANDASYCGEAPAWITEGIVERADSLVDQLSDGTEKMQIRDFALGAIRYVSDQAGSECDVLLAHLSNLVD